MRYLHFLIGFVLGAALAVAGMYGYNRNNQRRADNRFERTAECRKLADSYNSRLTDVPPVEGAGKIVNEVIYSSSLNACIASVNGGDNYGQTWEIKDVLTDQTIFFASCSNPRCGNGVDVKNEEKMSEAIEKLEN